MEQKKDGFIGQKAIVVPPAILESLGANDMTRTLHITDIGYYPHAHGHFRERENGSPQHILVYCTEGEGWVSFGGSRNRVREGQFFIIEAATPQVYAASASNPWTIYWLHFAGDDAGRFAPHCNRIHTIDSATDTRSDDRIRLFENIYSNLEMGYHINNLQYVSLSLWHLLGAFLFVAQFCTTGQTAGAITPGGDPIQLAINHMKAHIGDKLTLQEIAAQTGYSPSYFGQLFLRQTGYAPLCYFAQLKIQEACSLLDFSEMKIKEIAYRLGFYDQYHFSKTFREQTGESPRAYRQRRKG